MIRFYSIIIRFVLIRYDLKIFVIDTVNALQQFVGMFLLPIPEHVLPENKYAVFSANRNTLKSA